MGILKNEVGRPSNETLKTRRILKTLIVIIVVALIFLGGYMLSGITENNNKTNNKEQTETSAKQEVDKILAQQILDNFVYNDYDLLVSENFSEDYRTILAIKHTKGITRVDSCKELFGSNFEKIDSSTGYVNGFGTFVNEKPYCYDDKNYIDDNNFYDYSLVEKEYKKLFGEPVDLSKGISFTRYDGGAIIYGYSKNKNGYVELSLPVGGMWNDELHTIKEAFMLDGKLHIEFSFFFYSDMLNNDGTLRIFANNNDFNIKVNNISEEELQYGYANKENTKEKLKYVFDEYDSKLPKYEIVFEKENDNYILHAMYQKN